MSGVKQPNISAYLSGQKPIGNIVLQRLLGCLGYRAEYTLTVEKPQLTRHEKRSWALHRHISIRYTDSDFRAIKPRLLANLDLVWEMSQGEPYETNILEWREVIDRDDWLEIRQVLTGLDCHSIEMREVSPMRGLLSDSERREVLAAVS